MGTATPSPHDWKEWRRLRAWDLHKQGWAQHDIAIALDVTEGAVSKWIHQATAAGRKVLRSHSSPGPPAKLSDAQRCQIPDFLRHGAEAYGFRGDVWTCQRVVQVIEWEFGVRYHKDHVSRMLRDLGWTPQIPNTRAVQRDEAAIARWRTEVWPMLRRQASQERRALVFVDETGIYLLPGIVRTYDRREKLPLLTTNSHVTICRSWQA